MESVFVTKSTFFSIIEEIDVEKIPKELLGKIIYEYTDIDYLYTKQVNTILAYKFIAENPDKLMVYKKTKQTNSSSNFLIKTSRPKYHLFKDCETIHSRFENMYIPKQIIDKGDNIISEFREYLINEFGKFDAKKYSERKDLIVSKINSKFGVQLLPNDVHIIIQDNTGETIAKNPSLPELQNTINKLANEYKSLCEKYKDIFPKYTMKAFLSRNPDKLTFIPLEYYKQNKKGEFIKILSNFFQDIQLPTYESLRQYYMVKLNPDLEFSGQLMDQLGLGICYKCSERYNVKTI